ncbi:hypothetical protein SISNIDRAFT_460906 [Sistotremastrum niveocremeum HHB9708]|uniref:Uncharacterized protein n=1 Tax=Sistotremastrum niveocremeum HHB9708 TaxID=1314777 RepID=A0A164N6W7_9AGAM|nr:hypothetical protein SISNIDRAFT_460906 [Sistotremastrum niveocremeum HHB9708]
MFGEGDSESPRVASPWDPLISPPSASPLRSPSPLDNIPKLVPELQDGNIEYKLKLTDPSPERFLRLVTQLKWRLLEGGGQAYYELGVADSGQLIGLSREDLDRSLETLEMMAGEIAASVIVVKEIEVPKRLVEVARRAGGVKDMALAFKRRRRGRRVDEYEDDDTEVVTTTTEADTTTTDADDDDHLFVDSSSFSSPYMRSHPGRPAAQSSPFIHPRSSIEVDSNLSHPASSSPPIADKAVARSNSADLEDLQDLLFDLEISSVYKPLPSRPLRPSLVQSPFPDRRYTKKGTPPNKEKKDKKEKERMHDLYSDGKGRKARERRLRRDARRALDTSTSTEFLPLLSTDKLVAEDEAASLSGVIPAISTLAAPISAISKMPLVPSLIAASSSSSSSVSTPSQAPDSASGCIITSPRCQLLSEQSAEAAVIEADGEVVKIDDPLEPRFIVEALVVRKLSIEEAFLDFGGFSLMDG